MSDDMIFDLTKPGDYRGIFFGEVDLKEIEKDCPCPPAPNFHAGMMAIIFIDENKDWQLVARIKFSTGAKQKYTRNFGKDGNETIILQELYKMPMINKIWTKNTGGDAMGILKIIQDMHMIESYQVMPNEKA